MYGTLEPQSCKIGANNDQGSETGTGGDSATENLNIYYNAGDIAWMITATALVLLMIPGVG